MERDREAENGYGVQFVTFILELFLNYERHERALFAMS